MSRPIKLTQELIDECRQDFEKALSLTKLSDGKLSFTKAFSCGDRKAVVYFSAEAWAKMTMLIKEFDKEVAWHGVARRTEDESLDEYVIDDIVVYPQEVTGATVEMDTEKYALWIQENIEDERFNHIYMQGHSHVNMGTSPSSVDLNHQEEILGMLGDNDFYIFMIWNMSFASTNKIYDLKKNVMFEDILEKEDIVTYRGDDLPLLMSIRKGDYQLEDGTYRPEFFEMVSDFEKRLNYAKQNTSLPDNPDMKKVEEFVMSVNRRAIDA